MVKYKWLYLSIIAIVLLCPSLVLAAGLGPPTDFTLTETGVDTISITWVKGVLANTTVIRASLGGYPTGVTDGELVYNDTGTSTTDSKLSLENTKYYYRAWSWNAGDGYSNEYAQDSIGGEEMIILAFIGIIFGAMILGFVFKRWYLFILAGFGAAGVGIINVSTNDTATISWTLGWVLMVLGVMCFIESFIVQNKVIQDQYKQEPRRTEEEEYSDLLDKEVGISKKGG